MVEKRSCDEEMNLVILEFERTDEAAVCVEQLEKLLREMIDIICDVYSTLMSIALNRVATDAEVRCIHNNIALINERIEKAEEIVKKLAKKMGITIG